MLEQEIKVQAALLMVHRIEQIGKMLTQFLVHKGIFDHTQGGQVDLPGNRPGQVFPEKTRCCLSASEGLAEKTVMGIDDFAHGNMI